MQPESQIPSTEPDVKVDLLFGKDDIKEAIADCERMIGEVRVEMREYRDVIKDLLARKSHYQKLMDEGKYNRISMESSMVGMDVEIRKYKDAQTRLVEKKNHYQNIVEALNVKLREAEKWESPSITLQALSQ